MYASELKSPDADKCFAKRNEQRSYSKRMISPHTSSSKLDLIELLCGGRFCLVFEKKAAASFVNVLTFLRSRNV